VELAGFQLPLGEIWVPAGFPKQQIDKGVPGFRFGIVVLDRDCLVSAFRLGNFGSEALNLGLIVLLCLEMGSFYEELDGSSRIKAGPAGIGKAKFLHLRGGLVDLRELLVKKLEVRRSRHQRRLIVYILAQNPWS
jgi:hypothetical protein